MPRALPLAIIASSTARVDLERDVQVEVVLLLEVERHVRRLEEREEASRRRADRRCAAPASRAGLGLADLERAASGRPRKSS
jgi:hypothetical protein